jgi:tetratricopeptide (TPR) repeat protein
VAEPSAIKYRAFLSYSHRDTAWGKWLHAALEGYRVDKDLVGRATPAGPVPKSLRPIFRDREDFSAGHSLTEQTLAALEASQFLVVICSPNATKSKYVNEEIRRFKAQGGADRVIPLIVDGEPGDAERECFPPALRFVVNPGGEITAEPEEPIAADAREQGDGKEIAKQKLVAGLLGVGLDEIARRAEHARRRRNRFWGALAGVFLLLAIAASASAVYAWHQLKTNEAFLDATLDRFTSLVNRAVNSAQAYSMPLPVTLGFLEEAEGMLDVMAKYGRPTPKLRQRQIAMLIAFADNYRDLGKTPEWEKRLAQAQRLAAELARDNGTDPEWRWEQARTDQRIGDLHLTKGDLSAALADYRACRDIMEELAKLNPNNPGWQRDVSVCHQKIGQALAAQGHLAEALASYRASLAVAERLAQAAPDNVIWQRNVAVARNFIGNALLALGSVNEALENYRAQLATMDRLAAADPNNALWQRDLSVAYLKVGEAQVAQRTLADALASFRAGLDIMQRLTRIDPLNAMWQRDVLACLHNIGGVQVTQGDLPDALTSFRAALAIAERLAQSDPENALWQRDLAETDERLGDVLTAQGSLDEALASLRTSLAIRERQAKAEPNNPAWQHDLAMSHGRLAIVFQKQGDPAQAAELQAGRAIMAALLARAPGYAQWVRDLAWFDEQIAALETAAQKAEAAPH